MEDRGRVASELSILHVCYWGNSLKSTTVELENKAYKSRLTKVLSRSVVDSWGAHMPKKDLVGKRGPLTMLRTNEKKTAFGHDVHLSHTNIRHKIVTEQRSAHCLFARTCMIADAAHSLAEQRLV